MIPLSVLDLSPIIQGSDATGAFRNSPELMAYFAPTQPRQAIRAVPGAGLKVPLWILGSSLFGAQLAAALGLPFAFASHFAPDKTGVEELMVTGQIYDHAARLRSFEIAADLRDKMSITPDLPSRLKNVEGNSC